ncbi:hypothetical protein JX266_012927 [Neoarthrinium moseri]|nr:hypothetical protein JX266_012927 [Neoarthrinium moseri]
MSNIFRSIIRRQSGAGGSRLETRFVESKTLEWRPRISWLVSHQQNIEPDLRIQVPSSQWIFHPHMPAPLLPLQHEISRIIIRGDLMYMDEPIPYLDPTILCPESNVSSTLCRIPNLALSLGGSVENIHSLIRSARTYIDLDTINHLFLVCYEERIIDAGANVVPDRWGLRHIPQDQVKDVEFALMQDISTHAR